MANYEEAKTVCQQLTQAGFQTMFAGGCVRDRLLGIQPKDFDLATTATPQQGMQVLSGLGYQVIAVGLEHGTFGVVTSAQLVEITTLRQDIACDGRHAEVAFTNNFQADAERRDLTINGLFEDSNGKIHDFVGGFGDIYRKKLRFIGNAEARIQEDYLRIIRYFRFLARLGWTTDPQAVKAITLQAQGIQKLAMERLLREFDQILILPHREAALKLAHQTGCLKILFGSVKKDSLKAFSQHTPAHPISSATVAWFCFFWHALKLREWQLIQALMSNWRFSNRRKRTVKTLWRFFSTPKGSFDNLVALLQVLEIETIKKEELNALFNCFSKGLTPGLVFLLGSLKNSYSGTAPEFLRKDILSIPEQERAHAILTAKIFWYLGWCGGKTQLSMVLKNAVKFRNWIDQLQHL